MRCSFCGSVLYNEFTIRQYTVILSEVDLFTHPSYYLSVLLFHAIDPLPSFNFHSVQRRILQQIILHLIAFIKQTKRSPSMPKDNVITVTLKLPSDIIR